MVYGVVLCMVWYGVVCDVVCGVVYGVVWCTRGVVYVVTWCGFVWCMVWHCVV